MSATTLDVLVHLLTNYFQDDCSLPLPEAQLRTNLRANGFADQTIQKAFSWLDQLQTLPEVFSDGPSAVYRMTEIFSAYEKQRLDPDAQSFLHGLLAARTLSAKDFECVMSQAMLLDSKLALQEHEMKAIVMLVLFHSKHGDARGALAQIEKEVLVADGSIGVQ